MAEPIQLAPVVNQVVVAPEVLQVAEVLQSLDAADSVAGEIHCCQLCVLVQVLDNLSKVW